VNIFTSESNTINQNQPDNTSPDSDFQILDSEKMMLLKIDDRGRLFIPTSIRNKNGIRRGDILAISLKQIIKQ